MEYFFFINLSMVENHMVWYCYCNHRSTRWGETKLIELH